MSLPRISFHGLFSRRGGYGTAARAYLRALYHAGLDCSAVDLDPCREVTDPIVQSLIKRPLIPDIWIVHHFLPEVALQSIPDHQGVVYVTTWEADRLRPDWIETLSRVREVWVPCDYNVSVFKRSLAVPIFKWPHAIAPLVEHNRRDYYELIKIEKDAFVFYTVGVWQGRKNQQGVIEAFLRAFTASDNAVLVVKTFAIPEPSQDIIVRLRRKTRSDARVVLVSQVWSDGQIEALARRGNCYVSLHRGEGWCYPLFDAVCRGMPAIATGYSGPLEYLNPDVHLLVRYTIKQLGNRDGWYCYPMRWAEPDIPHAAELMRYVYSHQVELSHKAHRAATGIVRRYSYERIGNLAKERLSWVL